VLAHGLAANGIVRHRLKDSRIRSFAIRHVFEDGFSESLKQMAGFFLLLKPLANLMQELRPEKWRKAGHHILVCMGPNRRAHARYV
jgi:hypothetical protein